MDNAELHTIQPNLTPEPNFRLADAPQVKTQDLVDLNTAATKASQEIPFVNLFRIQEFLGINNPDFKTQETIKNIYGFFEKRGLTDMNDIFINLNKMEQEIGNTPYGMSRLTHLWNYIKVLSQLTELKDSFRR